jgi:hypothetical protein
MVRALDREKAEQGAEKSCRKRRRRRGNRVGGRRSRGGKPPRTGSTLSPESKGIRARKRIAREDDWLERRTKIVMAKQSWWVNPERSSASTSVPPEVIYRGLAAAVSRITRFDEPMSYREFSKCFKDEMWLAMGCDITSNIRTMDEDDLEEELHGSNITLVDPPQAPPIFERPSWKKSQRSRFGRDRNLNACHCDKRNWGPTIVRFGELWQGCALCGQSWQCRVSGAIVSDEAKSRWASRGGPRRK